MIACINPRTGRPDFEIEAFGAEQIADLSGQMRSAQPAWEQRGLEARIATLLEWAQVIEAQRDSLFAALSADTGRHAIAAHEIQAVLAALRRWAAQAPELLAPETLRATAMPGVYGMSKQRAFPVLGVISPWNFPFLLAMIDTIPALLAGCAVLIKPSEITSRFVAPLQKTIERTPELAQILRLVTGDGRTGAALIDHTDMLCFTGSVATGRNVYRRCAERFIPCFLELGGKDPLLVLAGSDLDGAVNCALRASVQATGQACQSIERIYVHQSLYPEFVATLAERARAVQLNYPEIDQGQIGPFIMQKQAEVVAEQLADALTRGARILSGGEIERLGGGVYLRPTVLVDVDHRMRIMREETFGPVLPVMAFESNEQAIALANDSEFGLSASVFGPDEKLALAIGEQLEAGAISINDGALTSFNHDVEKQSFKASGLGGSRMGAAGIRRFLRRQGFLIQRGAALPISILNESRGLRA
jgi:acyl-CoA reductase-like NAD-dependent aldehyde dehydrogenase